jgi:hypothetical protein
MPVLVTTKRKAAGGPSRLEIAVHSESVGGRPIELRRLRSLMPPSIDVADTDGFRASALGTSSNPAETRPSSEPTDGRDTLADTGASQSCDTAEQSHDQLDIERLFD